jgi:prepilin-type processing-associated H-X9-DG protein
MVGEQPEPGGALAGRMPEPAIRCASSFPENYRPATSGNCDTHHFWILHPSGGNWLFADGSVRFLPYTSNAILPALATRSGGEVVADGNF